MEYRKTKSLLHDMEVLGHGNAENTMLCAQLVSFKEDDDFVCKVARTPREIKDLIENGFQHVCEKEGLTFFKKRK